MVRNFLQYFTGRQVREDQTMDIRLVVAFKFYGSNDAIFGQIDGKSQYAQRNIELLL